LWPATVPGTPAFVPLAACSGGRRWFIGRLFVGATIAWSAARRCSRGCWRAPPRQLTAQGHQFIEALRNKEMWATIKRGFKDASASTLMDVSKKLLRATQE
jgi:hypothetical protein